MNCETISAENILRLHDKLIERFGGLYGVRDEDLFLFLCDAPYQQFAGVELYPTLEEKAAKYIDGFARHQVFLDGNKRIAAATMMFFLERNRKHIVYAEGELAEFTLQVANTDISWTEIVANIRQHIIS